MTYYALCALSRLGIVWDLRVPSEAVMRGEHKLGRQVTSKVTGQLSNSFPVDPAANQALRSRATSVNVRPDES
jgi:stearoyl-CoA desaturase (delta-9 desaturase)